MTQEWIGTYILDEHGNPAPCDTLTWAVWFEKHDRHVAFSDLGIYKVSTVFLGLDLSWAPMLDPLLYRPVLWETMVFDQTFSKESPQAPVHAMRRYTSREEAVAGHEEMVKICLEAMRRQIALEEIE